MWPKSWLLKRAAAQNTLTRPLLHDDIGREALRRAREELRKNLAVLLHAPLPPAERLRRIATSVGEPLDLVPEPPPLSNESFRERNRAYAEQIKTRHELPALPGDLWQKWRRLHGKPGQP